LCGRQSIMARFRSTPSLRRRNAYTLPSRPITPACSRATGAVDIVVGAQGKARRDLEEDSSCCFWTCLRHSCHWLCFGLVLPRLMCRGGLPRCAAAKCCGYRHAGQSGSAFSRRHFCKHCRTVSGGGELHVASRLAWFNLLHALCCLLRVQAPALLKRNSLGQYPAAFDRFER